MPQSNRNGSRHPLLTLAAGAICISFAPVFVKMLAAGNMGPTAIAFWRTFIGAVILFAWSVARNETLSLQAPVMRWSGLAGFVFFLDLFFWHRSILYAGAGIATILANTQVFGTAVLSFLIFKERLSLKFFAAALGAVVGVALLIGLGSHVALASNYIRGVVFGLLTGLAYANYIVTLKLAGHKHRTSFVTLMAWTSLYSALFLGVATLIEHDRMAPPDLTALALLAALALVAQVLGWWAISSSLPKIAASRSGLTLLLQPVLATVWGVLFFNELLAPMQIVGALFTLAAIYVGSV
ncbi:MAG TPA: DMT family transporter, partial [Candidatus Deferrimicrobium sp.]|nr:DMT family transporter [Candidatus Deferrimicrobium sp.]